MLFGHLSKISIQIYFCFGRSIGIIDLFQAVGTGLYGNIAGSMDWITSIVSFLCRGKSSCHFILGQFIVAKGC